MKTMERLRKIKEHFKNINMDEFEMNLEKAGMGVINPCSSDDMEMVLEDLNCPYDDVNQMEFCFTPGYNLFLNDFVVAA